VVKIRSTLHRIAASDLIRIYRTSHVTKPDCFRFGLSWQQVQAKGAGQPNTGSQLARPDALLSETSARASSSRPPSLFRLLFPEPAGASSEGPQGRASCGLLSDLCATEPAVVARRLVDNGFTDRYDDALQMLSDLPYDKWREYVAEDTVRFYALRLHEAGMIKASPQKIIADGTDWRFLNELKRELKA
jgi:hypothetical protein